MYAYAYDNERSGKIVAATDVLLVETVEVAVAVGSAEHVTATLTEASTYATKASLEAHASSENNPHNVTKAQIGLGEVQNVSVDNMAPSIGAEMGQWHENITKGLTLSGLMRKIKDGFASIWTHMTDAPSHCGVGDKDKWNNKADGDHRHNASDINSGILSVDRGGTGTYNHSVSKENVNLNLELNNSKKSERISASSIATGYGYLVMATVTMRSAAESDVMISLDNRDGTLQTSSTMHVYPKGVTSGGWYDHGYAVGYVVCRDANTRPQILVQVSDDSDVIVSDVTFCCLRLFKV